MKLWLVVIGLTVAAAVVVALFVQYQEREEKRDEAEMFCTMDESIPSIYSPEFKNCVDQYVD